MCQVSPSKDAADPPDLEIAKAKGDQTQLDVSPVLVEVASTTITRLARNDQMAASALSLGLAGKILIVLDCGTEDLLVVVEVWFPNSTKQSSTIPWITLKESLQLSDNLFCNRRTSWTGFMVERTDVLTPFLGVPVTFRLMDIRGGGDIATPSNPIGN